ncbi:MAG: glutamine--fructose-6-phosphate aminotransferase [Candidatus Liptonbacteria bacterium RIFCSPHIGHO2_01_FULL_57_28]|uniref:Glutamine--fructose-6-phosphate aminotransferase [isomerizing] n=1 Tax=Candidatus Liptonbacteria bacterium RIFCSPHIGHO2_01_FULL_57_28 TaxID=1798647 RepID=A0A1G2CBN3_9BACT|nr:MAG: glutamine--fructose-6-phosphate aminotransferase [Candidatus Liptonbacteria bacterium RIFCSPHIGHO2_01_FULL_57_28]
MCGIVGYLGSENATPFLLGGLTNLEYRGYDSAGIAIYDGGKMVVEKTVGRVGNLKEKIKTLAQAPKGKLGIAHTRWATHGGVTDANAHPHGDCTDALYIVHNGIIENYKELKSELADSGHIFKSETDTEVLAHLIEEHYKPENKRTLFEAVRDALKKVRGTYGLTVISVREPDRIIAARNFSPLILGLGEHGNVVASDASAFVGMTKKVVYLNDGEIAELTADDFRIETLDSEVIARTPEMLEWETDKIRKDGHEHFLHKEIFEAPATVRNAIRGRLVSDRGLAKLGGVENVKEELRGIERIMITACGTASYAGRVGEYMLEEYAGIPVEVDIGSELRYRKAVFDKKTALIAISQSGETADTLGAVREAKEKGVLTLGIVNVVGSSIARECGVGIYNHAGPEISVASTKAFISQLSVLALLTLFLGRQRNMSLATGKRIAEELQKLPELLSKVLEQEARIRKIAEKYKDAKHMLFLGRKYNYPIALEGALKLKETAYIHAEGQAAGEFKHGSIAMIDQDFPSFFILPKDSVYEKTRSNLEEIKARGGPVIALTTEGNAELDAFTEDVIYIPKTLEMLSPILTAIPTYLFAYHIATMRGNDVDRPRNLAKSVTVE